MGEVRVPAKVVARNDIAANWAAANPVMLKGEIALETDTGKIKFGDGVKSWSELPYFALSVAEVVGIGTAASLDFGIGKGNIPVLGEDGKLNAAVIPAIALMDISEVSSEAEMLALDVQKGDIAVRSDTNQMFILKQSPATLLDNWIAMKVPVSGVVSVNGQTGVITLNTDNIPEGSSTKYYTAERAASDFATAVAKTSVSDLKDGNSVLKITDTLILNGGNASG